MDLFKAIEALREEKRRIDVIIEHLEGLQSGRAPAAKPERQKRGRKGMNEEERAAVSERMKAYWAGKQKPAQGKPKQDKPPAAKDS